VRPHCLSFPVWTGSEYKRIPRYLRLRRRLRNLRLLPETTYKAISRNKPVKTVSMMVIAAFLISLSNNPNRPVNVATRVSPNIHLADFQIESPIHSCWALQIPTCATARAIMNAKVAKYSKNTPMLVGTAIETPTNASPRAAITNVNLVALITPGEYV
jgi:hypothetical protein